MKSRLFWCYVLWSTGSIFCGTDKSSTLRCLSKCCYQCVSQLLIRNFEHSRDRSSYLQNGTFKEITITATEVVLSQVSFLPSVLNKKIKMTSRNIMTSSYHLKVGSTQNMEVPFSSLIWVNENGIISPYLEKGKAFADNSNLACQRTFNICMETVNELNVFLTGFILCLKNVLAVPQLLY